MTTQKTFKARVRARTEQTGESYSAARAQLLKLPNAATEPSSGPVDARALTGTSDDAIIRGSGRPLAEWLNLLDAWDARARRHPEIVRWLMDEHAVPSWYAQTITVGYERARGMRTKHQNATGFAVSASKTIRAEVVRVTEAFTDETVRRRWLPDAPMRPRTVTPGRVARFDWDEPPSRLVVTAAETAPGRVQVAIQHERLPDAEVAERIKLGWRSRLGALKEILEGGSAADG